MDGDRRASVGVGMRRVIRVLRIGARHRAAGSGVLPFRAVAMSDA
jgi:hypothetical protein